MEGKYRVGDGEAEGGREEIAREKRGGKKYMRMKKKNGR